MRTVAELVEEYVEQSAFLEDALAEGLINLSALARQMKPDFERALFKPISEAAITMALRRLTPRWRQIGRGQQGPLRYLESFTVRSDLTELTFLRSETLIDAQRALLLGIRDSGPRFLTSTQGVFELTVILDARLEGLAMEAFSEQKMVARLGNLAAITIRLAKESVQTPGVHYAVLKLLALRKINLVEVVSTYTELTVILHKEQIDRAFSVLMNR